MDEALLKLLERKDLAYITVKEVCEVAGVNRSTFYLHYESMTDLLSESVGYMNDHFLIHMNRDVEAFATKLRTCPVDELYLVTPEYLTPYLSYIKKNKRLFRAAMNNAAAFYIQGLMAIVSEWLRHDCADSIEYVIGVIQRCMQHGEEGL